ncbi:MAG: hypothetical protein HY746_07925 [Elusimicrobia bacterium]|nr:hypothetical protein [Elusimicrobiota bacterium]
MKKLTMALTAFLTLSFTSAFTQELPVEFENTGISIDRAGMPEIATPLETQTKGVFDWIFAGNEELKPLPEKKWTIMVFINGKNDLEKAGLYNVNTMEKVGSNKDVNVVVEIGRIKNGLIDFGWTGSRRLYIEKDGDEDKIKSKVLMKTAKVDMGDFQRATEFVKWSKQYFPAKKYMLVLWDHGTGWLDPAKAEKDNSKGISFDDETGNYIRTQQIGRILKDAGKVDILAFDACLMQMAEVLAEVKDNADFVLGSEELFPGLGYPYDLILTVFKEYPDKSAETMASLSAYAINAFYKAAYPVIKKGIHISAIKANQTDKFHKLLGEFAGLAIKSGETDALRTAKENVMRYDILAGDDPGKTISFFGDIYNFAEILKANLKGTDGNAENLKAKIDELLKFISTEFVIANYTVGADMNGRDLKDSHGISAYIAPVTSKIDQTKLESVFENKYADFVFAKATGWHDLVTLLYGLKQSPASMGSLLGQWQDRPYLTY